MAATDFIVAIELGSTKITGIVGKKNPDGSIRILAYAKEHLSDCIKKGTIYNLDKTTQCINSVIKRLENIVQAPIKKVYIGIGGQSIHSIHNKVTKRLTEEMKISQALIDSMLESNQEMPLADSEILATELQGYKLGNNQFIKEPVGIQTDHIEGHYLNIVARNSLKSNIQQCLYQTGYEIAGYILSPLATANVILKDNEKRSGCALIDFGAETTTVSVYKNNILRHLAVIPLGSNNITKDICSLQIEEDDAEALKVRYANALTEPTEEDYDISKEYCIDGKCKIDANELERIVEARVKEIIENIWNQIKLSEYSDKLLAGIIITGGTIHLPNLSKAISNITQIEKIRIAQAGEFELQDAPDDLSDGTNNTLLGILNSGKENCCKLNPHGQQSNMWDDFDKQKANEEKQKEQKRMHDCEALIVEAQQLTDNKKYEDAQKKAEEALNMHIAEKENILNELISKIKKLKTEEKEKQIQQECIRNCDKLTAEAQRLLERKKYKEARNKAEEACSMHIPEKEKELNELIAEIEKQKTDNNPFKRLIKTLKESADDIMKD